MPVMGGRKAGVMPRENIDDIVSDGFRITVGWQRDREVQIATVNRHSTFTFTNHLPATATSTTGVPFHATAGSPFTAIAGPVLPGPGDEPPFEPESFDGWHVTLDRASINRLIRVLRTARDQAFGRDE